MSAPSPIIIEALIERAEQPVLIAAAEQISECLGAANQGPPWPVRLQFRPPGAALDAAPAPSVVVASLLAEVTRTAEPLGETEARWRTYVEALQASGATVFVMTVFRHVRDRAKDGAVSPVLERIRRLNYMSASLSHDLGIGVIDIDRAFTHIGGRTLQTDYRLTGALAAEVGGHTVAWSFLSLGLDKVIDPDLQEKAKLVLGGLHQIDDLVSRRFAQRRAAQAARDVTPSG